MMSIAHRFLGFLLVLLLVSVTAGDLAAQRKRDKKAEEEENRRNEARLLKGDEAYQLNAKMQLKTMVHVQTKNFLLHYDIKRLKVGQLYYDRVDGAFLYSRRIEELLRDYKKVMGEPHKYPTDGVWNVWIAATERDRNKIRATLLGGASSIFGPKTSVFITSLDRKSLNNDEALHANVYHFTSQLISRQGYNHGQGNYPGWFSIGLAHWLEIQKFGETRNFTTGEVAAAKDRWQMGKWPKKVASKARRSKEPLLASFCDKDGKKLNAMLSAFSWSYVDFIYTRFPEKRGDFARALAGGKLTKDAMRELFGWSLARFQDEWRKECVKKMGQIGPKPPRKPRR